MCAYCVVVVGRVPKHSLKRCLGPSFIEAHTSVCLGYGFDLNERFRSSERMCSDRSPSRRRAFENSAFNFANISPCLG